jgi:GYF domain 2
MSAYYLHDGQNEVGPFTLDILKNQKLSRSTPIRQKGSDNWMPAEKLDVLKELVAPKKIRRPKDILPVVGEQLTVLKQKKPLALYSILFGVVLLASLSIYSVSRTVPPKAPEPVAPIQSAVPETVVIPSTLKQTPATESPKPKEQKPLPTIKEDKGKVARLRWNKLISATNSNYGIGLLGGIKDLNVVITNRSDYTIDETVLKLTYIKANGSVWKTKLVNVFGVPAHETKEEPVPDVGRGKKVKVSIQKIVSKKMNFSYTEGQTITNVEDPYRMK